MYDTLIFDFFGVICADPQKSWLSRHSLPTDTWASVIAKELDTGLINYKTYIERLAKSSGQFAKKVHSEMLKLQVINYELVEILEAHKPFHKIGLLSNSHVDEIVPILNVHGLTGLFDHLTISSAVGIAKPDPKIFTFTLDKLGSKPESTIFIDDNHDNVAAAEKLGIKGIHFKDCPSLADELRNLIKIPAK